MIVNVENIENEVLKIKEDLREYESILLNYYNEISYIEDNWKSNKALSFFEETDIVKNSGRQNYNNMCALKNIYEYMVEEYKKIGNKIEINLDSRESINRRINLLVKSVNSIINKYQQIITYNTNSGLNNILTEEEKIFQELNTFLEKMKDDINDVFQQIFTIETKVANQLNQLSNDLINKETIL